MRSRRKVTHWTPKGEGNKASGTMSESDSTPPVSPMEEKSDKVGESSSTETTIPPTEGVADPPGSEESAAPEAPAAEPPSTTTAAAAVTTESPPSPPPISPAPAPAETPAPPPPEKDGLPPPVAPIAGPSAAPAPRRPKPPTKGILKPPPPPSKPTLGGRLRDLASTVVGARQLFELEEAAASVRSSTPPGQAAVGMGNTLNALGGRLSAGLSRFVASGSPPVGGSPSGSPMPRSVGLPDVGGAAPNGTAGIAPSEKAKQKQPLKRATFVLPSLSITYPISTAGEPWSIKIIEERKQIESNHRSIASNSTGANYWTSHRLVALYESACRGREERPRVGIIRSLEVISPPPRSRHLHLLLRPSDPSGVPSNQSGGINITDIPLGRHAADALADVLSPEWGLSDLKLEGGVLESEDAIKPILHALLISGTLPSLSLAGNKRIRAGGWRLLAVFLKKARSLRFIDLSETAWDKKSAEYLVQALTCSQVRPPPPKVEPNGTEGKEAKAESPVDQAQATLEEANKEDAIEPDGVNYGSFLRPAPLLKVTEEDSAPAAVQTLRMDGCAMKAGVLDTLAAGIRSSDLRNISLRRNRIGPLGAVAMALMIRDYPDSALSMSSFNPQSAAATAPQSAAAPTEAASNAYTPYAPRHRRPTVPNTEEPDENLPPIPLVVASSPGVTSRTVPDGYTPPPPPKYPLQMPSSGASPFMDQGVFGSGINSTPVEGRVFSEGGASMALQRSVRALDGVERIGRLLTLDLKGNEIKTGVGYIAQVLKRNRTLKVLNLSDNKIEPAGLVALAESLKYNSTLETLDISSNPCCGLSLDGIAALRTAFTVNTSLKRLFLSDTHLTSEGAIALAEFLPETKSLLHLDLTSNPVDTAGIMAISSGLKSNKLIRCLDISIPPNNPELAEMSQSILQSCIRNTELAAASLASSKSTKSTAQDAIWAPIKKSTLVQSVKNAEQLRADQERVSHAQSPEGLAREYAYTLKPADIAPAAEILSRDLEKWYDAANIARKPGFHAWEPNQLPKEEYASLLERAKALRERLADQLQESTDDSLLASLLPLTDTLSSLIERSTGFKPPPRLLLPSQIVPTFENRPPPSARYSARRHMRTTSLEISSPNFSIGDSDGESDAEELDVGKLPSSPPRQGSGAVPVTPPPRGLGLGMGMGIRTSGMDGIEIERGMDEDERDEHSQSPVERTRRAWVEEEGEIFRKGTRLGVAEEEEVEEHKDVSGEELKQEILEIEVARSPTRRIIDVGDEEESEKKDEDGEA